MDNNQAEFHLHAVLNVFRSKLLGRPVYEDKIYITIYVPNDEGHLSRNHIHSRLATDADKYTHPEAWAKFELEQRDQVAGTPISYLPGVTPGLQAELHSLDIFTLEQLIESECQIDPIHKRRAKAYLAAFNEEETTQAPPKKRGRPKKVMQA